jgi:Ca2+-binding EF-hand superfamily protein
MGSLKEMCLQENELEMAKTALTLKCDFNLHDAYHIFDPHHRGLIDSHDLRAGLTAINVHPTSEQIELFITRYDKNGDRRLCFQEFSAAFAPLDSFHGHMLTRRCSNGRKACFKRDDCFFADTQREHCKVWDTHFRCETQAENVRQRLQRFPCFDVLGAFNSLDLKADGGIDACELRRMIESRGIHVTGKEISDLVDRFDTSKSGKICYGQFAKEICPKSPVRH